MVYHKAGIANYATWWIILSLMLGFHLATGYSWNLLRISARFQCSVCPQCCAQEHEFSLTVLIKYEIARHLYLVILNVSVRSWQFYTVQLCFYIWTNGAQTPNFRHWTFHPKSGIKILCRVQENFEGAVGIRFPLQSTRWLAERDYDHLTSIRSKKFLLQQKYSDNILTVSDEIGRASCRERV